MMNNTSIKIMENGIEKEYEIFGFCNNPKLNKNYIIYTDKKDDSYYASRYIIKDNYLVLEEIIDDEEWDFLDMELSKIG